MNATNILLHKVVINCIRPKSTSKTDVSRSEAKLMYAINTGCKFSLPHTILMHIYRTVVKDKGQLPYSTLISQLFEHFKIKLPAILCARTIPPMVIGLKMVSKMRLKELSKELERFKEKSPVKANQDSVAKKRKGKEPMTEPVKKRRSLILEDKEEDDDDITISALALRNLQSYVNPTKIREQGRTRERDDQEGRRSEERRSRDDSFEPTQAASDDSEKTKSKKTREHHYSAEAELEEEHTSPPKTMKTGGDAENRGTSSPIFTSDVSRSPPDPEAVYASQFPESDFEAFTPTHGDGTTDVPPQFQTPTSTSAGPSTAKDHSADLQRVMELLLELKG